MTTKTEKRRLSRRVLARSQRIAGLLKSYREMLVERLADFGMWGDPPYRIRSEDHSKVWRLKAEKKRCDEAIACLTEHLNAQGQDSQSIEEFSEGIMLRLNIFGLKNEDIARLRYN
jgi:hypothetical protein